MMRRPPRSTLFPYPTLCRFKVIRLLVDDEPFDVRYGRLVRHHRVLDLRAGTLRREVEWISPAGQAVRVRSTRLDRKSTRLNSSHANISYAVVCLKKKIIS